MKDSYTLRKVTICTLPDKSTILLPYEHIVDCGNKLFYIGVEKQLLEPTLEDGKIVYNTVDKIVWGVMKDFKVIAPPSFLAIGPYAEGLIAVQVQHGSLWGYINLEGEMVIQPRFTVAGVFMYGIAKVTLPGGLSFWIDKDGKRLKDDSDERY